jgi:hypothetical protein
MTRHVVVHHAHHPDEKVYRLIHARVDDVPQRVEVENPNYDPEAVAKLELAQYQTLEVAEGNGNRPAEAIQFDPEIHSPTKIEEQMVPVYSNYQDVVWADWDEQWEGLSDDEIAAKQRQIVKDAIAAHEQELLDAQQAARDVRHIGETEVEL